MTTPIVQGPVDVNVRPVIAAYKDFCGVSDARFDTATDAEMIAGAAYPGYDDYRAGWDAAIAAIASEVERLTWAIDLPSWPGHVHRIETPEDAEPFAEMSDLIQRTVRTRLENVETVFATLEAGATTINECMKRTGLGKKVVQRAMVALEKDGRIDRKKAPRANQSDEFVVLS